MQRWWLGLVRIYQARTINGLEELKIQFVTLFTFEKEHIVQCGENGILMRGCMCPRDRACSLHLHMRSNASSLYALYIAENAFVCRKQASRLHGLIFFY